MRSGLILIAVIPLSGCGDGSSPHAGAPADRSPMFDGARYAMVSARLRDAFVLHDSAYCDSVLPLFDDTALVRMHPDRVVDGFVSSLITHEAPQPSTQERFNELVAYSGAPVMCNWRDYLAARTLQNAGLPQQAIAAFDPLLVCFRADHDTVGSASVNKRIGSLYLDLGEPAIAAAHFAQARTLEPRVDLRSAITAMLGRCYALTGNVDSLRWCAARLNEDAVDPLNDRRKDDRAAINAQWLRHLAGLLDPANDNVRDELRQAASMDSAILEHDSGIGFLVAAEPAARVETLVLRSRALLRLGRAREAIRVLEQAEKELARCTECLPQRLTYLSTSADALAQIGDLRAALYHQQERAEVLAQNEVGRERLAVEQARAKAERIQQEAEAGRLLEQERAKARVKAAEDRWQRLRLLVLIGFITLIAALIINHARLKRRIQLEQLRSRLSRDLHDDIGSTLSSISILSAVARKKAEAGDGAGAAVSLARISERSERLQRNMNDIVWSVDPNKDSTEELLARMRDFGSSVLEPKEIAFHFETAEGLPATLPSQVKNNLYMIFKEAVNNAAKHARATCVTVRIGRENGELHMEVADDGQGLDAAGTSPDLLGGNGLRNMRARAQEMKAVLHIRGSAGKGTTIELAVRT